MLPRQVVVSGVMIHCHNPGTAEKVQGWEFTAVDLDPRVNYYREWSGAALYGVVVSHEMCKANEVAIVRPPIKLAKSSKASR